MKPESDREAQEHYRDEYKEASSNLRHYSTLRFAVFTVFLAVQAGLIGFGLNASAVRSIVVKIAGLIAAFIFWMYTERINAYRRLFLRRASELENRLGFEQYVALPKPMLGFLTTLFATRFFFLAVAAFWVSTFWLR
jgi:hypothetical protein